MKNTKKKPLSNAKMALVIAIVLAGGAIPVYLSAKGNPWPCVAIFFASLAHLPYRRRQLIK